MIRLKKFFVLFTLLVFLFPFVEKEVHNFSHETDFHCNESDIHFHSEEHHCNVCDFTIDVNGSPELNQPRFKFDEAINSYFSFNENNLSLHEAEYSSLRAPPVVF